MASVSTQGPDSSMGRPPVLIPELEGLTILSAKLVVDEDGKDALILDGDDGTTVVVHVRQEPGEEPFLEVSGENILNLVEDESIESLQKNH